jgi:hypothetical protein
MDYNFLYNGIGVKQGIYWWGGKAWEKQIVE